MLFCLVCFVLFCFVFVFVFVLFYFVLCLCCFALILFCVVLVLCCVILFCFCSLCFVLFLFFVSITCKRTFCESHRPQFVITCKLLTWDHQRTLKAGCSALHVGTLQQVVQHCITPAYTMKEAAPSILLVHLKTLFNSA